jgi:GAF domain-containing protein
MAQTMKNYPTPDNEARRLEALRRYRILDTAPELAFDDFVELASFICETPTALITFVYGSRQWFKARKGMDPTETPREHAFCAHTIMGSTTMIVEDAAADLRFADNPLVKEAPYIRFYAGSPLIDSEGHALGTLCAIDSKPRPLSAAQRQALEALSRRVITQMELRRASAELASTLAELRTVHGLLPICSHCKGIRNDTGYWESVESYLAAHADVDFSHGICPTCFQDHYPELFDVVRDKLV